MKFVANADNASIETKVITAAKTDKVQAVVISKPVKFEIDAASSTSSLKLNYATRWGIAVSDYLLLEVNGSISRYQVDAVTETALGHFVTTNYRITGSASSGDTYALNSTSLPTVTNGTVTSNVFTASANAASAQTFDHVMTGEVESITPKMTFTNGNVLAVDPSSTVGNLKVSSTNLGLIAVNSKLLVEQSGVTTQVNVDAVTSSVAGLPYPNTTNARGWIYCNGYYFITEYSSGKVWVTADFNSFNNSLTIPNTPPQLTSVAYFGGKYYVGWSTEGTPGTASVYSSSDLINWSVAHSFTATGAGSSAVMTNGTTLVFAYGSINDVGATLNNGVIYKTTDGTTVNLVQTFNGNGNASTNVCIPNGVYMNGKFVFAAGSAGVFSSPDGTTWTNDNMSTAPGAIAARRAFTVIWDGTAYICMFKIDTSNTNWYFMRTTALGGTWTNVYTSTTSAVPCYEGGKYIAAQYGTKNVLTSADGITWSSSSITMTGNFGTFSSINPSDLHHLSISEQPNNANYVITLDFATLTWSERTLGSGTLYTITATTPSLTTNVPTWAGLGGQTEQYSVSATSTPSFNTATSPTYTRSVNVITATYAQVTGLSGTHVQLKALTLNNGDILSQIGADIVEFVGSDGWMYDVTSTTPALDSVPTLAFNGSMQISTSVAASGASNYVLDSVLNYQSDGTNVTTTTITRNSSGVDAKLKVENISNTEEISSVKLDLFSGDLEEINSATGNNTTSEVIPAGESRALIPTSNDWLMIKGV